MNNLLTGKAKENFINWCKKQTDLQLGIQIPNTIGGVVFSLNSNPGILPKRIINALIIEWFDSVGIYIEIGKDPINFLYIVHKGDYKKAHFKCGGFDTRQKATEEAIKKANEIYNKN